MKQLSEPDFLKGSCISVENVSMILIKISFYVKNT